MGLTSAVCTGEAYRREGSGVKKAKIWQNIHTQKSLYVVDVNEKQPLKDSTQCDSPERASHRRSVSL